MEDEGMWGFYVLLLYKITPLIKAKTRVSLLTEKGIKGHM